MKLYEKTGLAVGTHTIKIVCKSPVIDIDYFVHTQQSGGNAASLETISDFTSLYDAASFTEGQGWETFQAAKDRIEQLLAEGNAGQEEMAQAEEALMNAVLELRKPVRKELIGAPVVLPQETDTEQREIGTLYRVMVYAENLDFQNVIPAVRASYQEAFAYAQQVFKNPQSKQNEINRAWAELLDKIQYAGYTMGDKTELRKILAEDRKIDLSFYQNPQAFAKVLAEAGQILLDENALEKYVRRWTGWAANGQTWCENRERRNRYPDRWKM